MPSQDGDVSMDDQDKAMDDQNKDTEPEAAPAEQEDVAMDGEAAAPEDPPGPTNEERIGGAEASKEAGNALLKSGDFSGAVSKYAEGIGLAEPLLDKKPDDLAVELQQRGTELYVALRLNSAQACIKQSNWTDATEHANRVLLIDKENAKALYRRATASMQFDSESRLEQAKSDLTRFVQLEPANREARQMLTQARERLAEAKKREKERYSKAVQGGLYQEAHKKLERQKLEYEEEVKRRAEAGEDEISWEDWQKKLKEKEEDAKKKEKEAREARAKEKQDEEEQRQLSEENERRSAEGLEAFTLEEWRNYQKNQPKKEEVVTMDENDLDEEERKMLEETKNKGYYHGRLGTVLSNAAPKPKKLEGDAADSPEKDPGLAGGQRSSAWNEKGTTWEQKDTTAWVKERLTAWLQNAKVDSSSVTLPSGKAVTISAEISKVKSVSGTASIVFAAMQKRPGYSCQADLSFRVTLKDSSELAEEASAATDEAESKAKASSKRFEGTLSLPELEDYVQPKDLQIDAKWKGSSPPADLEKTVIEWLNKLRENVREQVAGFVAEYKEH